MSKDKKRDESKKPKKISVEAEVALLGLLLAITSLIGLLNQGWLGAFLTYILVYLFGSMYFIILLFNVYIGLYLFFKKKKPTIIFGINSLALLFLLFFLLIASSIFDEPSLSNWFSHFKNNIDLARTGAMRVDLTKISVAGGGLVGYGFYTLLTAILGQFVTHVCIVLVILGCLYILFKKPISELIKRIIVLVKQFREKSNEKKIISEVNEFNIDQNISEELAFEMGNDSKIEGDKAEERKKGLSFDIFNEPIFEEVLEKENIEVNNVIVENYGNQNDLLNIDERITVKEELLNNDISNKIEIGNEGLEFYGDEEVDNNDVVVSDRAFAKEVIVSEEIPDVPFVSEDIKIDSSRNSVFDIEDNFDVYSLLKENNENNAYGELRDEVELNCEKINQKLNELNIKASVNDYIIGPCVTRYEIVPEIGVRVSSIVNIENDLKLALAAVKTRMEAPIPGKSAVGIEVANKKRYPVYLKEVIYPFKDDDSKLLVGIGRDLNNKEIVLNIDKMPHLLVAGATGSGKSVCINSMIVSLLLRSTPDEVKLILIDPKKVEMLPYANMPHLLCPVVIDPKKASVALKKVVKEMDRRYDEFANNGVRNIEGYNKLKKENGEALLPNIVVIIDELADLMLVAAKEVEESIQRITQLARAAGIYLIVATQRPSVDVITGVIKANIPSRIAFSVSSQIDSRTIIDRGGAEELLGKGDMLMDISGSGALSRVQGVYVSDEEIFNVVKYIKSKYSTNFDAEFLNLDEESKETINNLLVTDDTNNDDKLYEDIRDFVIRNQKASTSLLQRYFTLGYARAARMIDRLESEGVIGEANGAKPREVLIKYNEGDNANG